ncbi:uncharacterized protein LOC142234355 [Haematobia irritans]|uniref:uncharacterized protein LOC142234355 n=1 Tax=Haematobia irritans TaxID=7368 RepID=UPI003F4F9DF4
MTDEVAESFSWLGSADKKCIRAFTVTTAIRQTFAENGDKEEDFVFASKSYVQYAKNRIKIKSIKQN